MSKSHIKKIHFTLLSIIIISFTIIGCFNLKFDDKKSSSLDNTLTIKITPVDNVWNNYYLSVDYLKDFSSSWENIIASKEILSGSYNITIPFSFNDTSFIRFKVINKDNPELIMYAMYQIKDLKNYIDYQNNFLTINISPFTTMDYYRAVDNFNQTNYEKAKYFSYYALKSSNILKERNVEEYFRNIIFGNKIDEIPQYINTFFTNVVKIENFNNLKTSQEIAIKFAQTFSEKIYNSIQEMILSLSNKKVAINLDFLKNAYEVYIRSLQESNFLLIKETIKIPIDLRIASPFTKWLLIIEKSDDFAKWETLHRLEVTGNIVDTQIPYISPDSYVRFTAVDIDTQTIFRTIFKIKDLDPIQDPKSILITPLTDLITELYLNDQSQNFAYTKTFLFWFITKLEELNEIDILTSVTGNGMIKELVNPKIYLNEETVQEELRKVKTFFKILVGDYIIEELERAGTYYKFAKHIVSNIVHKEFSPIYAGTYADLKKQILNVASTEITEILWNTSVDKDKVTNAVEALNWAFISGWAILGSIPSTIINNILQEPAFLKANAYDKYGLISITLNEATNDIQAMNSDDLNGYAGWSYILDLNNFIYKDYQPNLYGARNTATTEFTNGNFSRTLDTNIDPYNLKIYLPFDIPLFIKASIEFEFALQNITFMNNATYKFDYESKEVNVFPHDIRFRVGGIIINKKRNDEMSLDLSSSFISYSIDNGQTWSNISKISDISPATLPISLFKVETIDKTRMTLIIDIDSLNNCFTKGFDYIFKKNFNDSEFTPFDPTKMDLGDDPTKEAETYSTDWIKYDLSFGIVEALDLQTNAPLTFDLKDFNYKSFMLSFDDFGNTFYPVKLTVIAKDLDNYGSIVILKPLDGYDKYRGFYDYYRDLSTPLNISQLSGNFVYGLAQTPTYHANPTNLAQVNPFNFTFPLYMADLNISPPLNSPSIFSFWGTGTLKTSMAIIFTQRLMDDPTTPSIYVEKKFLIVITDLYLNFSHELKDFDRIFLSDTSKIIVYNLPASTTQDYFDATKIKVFTFTPSLVKDTEKDLYYLKANSWDNDNYLFSVENASSNFYWFYDSFFFFDLTHLIKTLYKEIPNFDGANGTDPYYAWAINYDKTTNNLEIFNPNITPNINILESSAADNDIYQVFIGICFFNPILYIPYLPEDYWIKTPIIAWDNTSITTPLYKEVSAINALDPNMWKDTYWPIIIKYYIDDVP